MTSHPIFARVFATLVRYEDRAGMDRFRRETLEGLTGRVVEVGAGTGANFAHYPDAVEHVLAVEPEPFLRSRAEESAIVAGLSVEVRSATAAELPLPTASVDAAVASLVLCSIDDPVAALVEMHRVVRPGGELRFFEHVRSHEARFARNQERVDAVWPRLAGGCHTARDTAAAIEAAGWRIVERRDFEIRPGRFPSPVAPHILGRAVRDA